MVMVAAVMRRRLGDRRRTGSARVRRLALVVGLAAAVTVMGTGTADACSITGEPPDYTTLANQADAVFVGTATTVEERKDPERFGTDRLWTVTVDEVIKGDVAQTQVVVSTEMGSCGTAIREPGRYVIYATERHDVGSLHSSEPMLVADTFGGTHVEAGAASIVPAEAGPRYAPRAGVAGNPDGRSRFSTLVVRGLVAAAVAAAAVGGGWLVHRRRRTST